MAGVDSKTLGRYIAMQRARRWLGSWLPGFLGGGGGIVGDGGEAATGGSGGGGGVFVPINTAKLVDDLLAVHGHEVRTPPLYPMLCATFLSPGVLF